MHGSHHAEPAEQKRETSLRSRAALAVAWLALQLLRLMFLPFLLIGASVRIGRRRSKTQQQGPASLAEPLPSAQSRR